MQKPLALEFEKAILKHKPENMEMKYLRTYD